MIASPDLLDRGDDARDVLRARQTVIAILNHGQHHVIAGQPMHQSECYSLFANLTGDTLLSARAAI